MALTVGQMQGKRLDLLGRVQYVPISSSAFNTSYLVFMTSNTDFRGDPVYIAYFSVDIMPGGTGATVFPAGSSFVLGSGGSTDFLGGAAVSIAGQPSGVIVYNQQTSSGGFNLVTYSPGIPIYVVNASSATSTDLAQFSAYGWAVN